MGIGPLDALLATAGCDLAPMQLAVRLLEDMDRHARDWVQRIRVRARAHSHAGVRKKFGV